MSSFKSNGPVHLRTETNGSAHEWCRRLEHGGFRARLTTDRHKVTCAMCIKRLAKLDNGDVVPLRVKERETQAARDARKYDKLWRELNGVGASASK